MYDWECLAAMALVVLTPTLVGARPGDAFLLDLRMNPTVMKKTDLSDFRIYPPSLCNTLYSPI